jgi:hypothetical protein
MAAFYRLRDLRYEAERLTRLVRAWQAGRQRRIHGCPRERRQSFLTYPGGAAASFQAVTGPQARAFGL